MKKPFFLAVVILVSLTSAFPEQHPWMGELIKNRTELTVTNGGFSGSGAMTLQNALSSAHFVLVGEDHATKEIPQFVGAICNYLGPQSLHTMAVEAGPLVAKQLQQWAILPDSNFHVAEFGKEYPDSIAFFNLKEENELLQNCAHAATKGSFQLWGLDQEFVGSPGYILQLILDTHPGKNAQIATQALVQKNHDAYAKAVKSGNPNEIFMFSASDEELANLKSLLVKEGNSQSQSLMDQLLLSRDIYIKNAHRENYASNRERAQLMKTTFARDYAAATKAEEGQPPKVLLKFGDWHMYKGINPLHSYEVGDYVQEIAEGQGVQSLHIIILGQQGSHLHFVSIGQPYKADESKLVEDNDYRFLKLVFDNLEKENWTLFDLRPLRAQFNSFEPMDQNMERLIFGYDLMVIIPEVHAATQIQ